MSFAIKKRLKEDIGIAFTYFIISVLILIIRRLQQIFLEVQIVTAIPHFSDFVTLIFAVFFFLAILNFYRSVKMASGSGRGSSQSFNNYKKNLGRKIIR